MSETHLQLGGGSTPPPRALFLHWEVSGGVWSPLSPYRLVRGPGSQNQKISLLGFDVSLKKKVCKKRGFRAFSKANFFPCTLWLFFGSCPSFRTLLPPLDLPAQLCWLNGFFPQTVGRKYGLVVPLERFASLFLFPLNGNPKTGMSPELVHLALNRRKGND